MQISPQPAAWARKAGRCKGAWNTAALAGGPGNAQINAVDEVTQWRVVGATAQISKPYLIPVLEAKLGGFPGL